MKRCMKAACVRIGCYFRVFGRLYGVVALGENGAKVIAFAVALGDEICFGVTRVRVLKRSRPHTKAYALGGRLGQRGCGIFDAVKCVIVAGVSATVRRGACSVKKERKRVAGSRFVGIKIIRLFNIGVVPRRSRFFRRAAVCGRCLRCRDGVAAASVIAAVSA